jgi:hypothetical protein
MALVAEDTDHVAAWGNVAVKAGPGTDSLNRKSIDRDIVIDMCAERTDLAKYVEAAGAAGRCTRPLQCPLT